MKREQFIRRCSDQWCIDGQVATNKGIEDCKTCNGTGPVLRRPDLKLLALFLAMQPKTRDMEGIQWKLEFMNEFSEPEREFLGDLLDFNIDQVEEDAADHIARIEAVERALLNSDGDDINPPILASEEAEDWND